MSLIGTDSATERIIRAEDEHVAHNYHPLPVVIASGEGAWVTDVDGKRYLDLLSAYSALNFGHAHPALLAAAREQLGRVTLTSRAYHNDKLGPFAAALAELCRKDLVLPMNTGAEAVETGIKVARAWGYRVKGVPAGQASIIVADGNFHGRTTTIVSFSDDPQARDGFGPFTPGFVHVPYGDAEAIADAIDDTTVAVLIEPIQGEAGVVIPPDGYLRRVREITAEKNVLFIADEIQSGLGRVGETFACDRAGVVPDLYLLGKALGGGILPLSAVVGNRDVLGVIAPGEHGSTFGGNALATAVSTAVLGEIERAGLVENAAVRGDQLREAIDAIGSSLVDGCRGRGLLIGVSLRHPVAGAVVAAAQQHGLIVNAANDATVRIAPALTIGDVEIDEFIDLFTRALRTVEDALVLDETPEEKK